MDAQQMMELLLKEIRASQKDFLARMDASHKKFMARMYYDRDTTEAPLEEEKLASVDTQPEATQEEDVPVEDTIVIPVGEPEEEMTSIT
jgi:hypothetical protein